MSSTALDDPHAREPRPTGRRRPDGTASHRNRRFRRSVAQLVSFGLIGGLAFVTDVGIYNLLRLTVLDDKPIGAKIISVAVATLVAWLGNRFLTFQGERSRSVLREGLLFAAVNVVGLLISAVCLFVSHYLLGFTSQLADNIAGNGVGLVLGMAFRFVGYRFLVFRPSRARSAASPSPVASSSPAAASSPGGSGPPQRAAHSDAPVHALPASEPAR